MFRIQNEISLVNRSAIDVLRELSQIKDKKLDCKELIEITVGYHEKHPKLFENKEGGLRVFVFSDANLTDDIVFVFEDGKSLVVPEGQNLIYIEPKDKTKSGRWKVEDVSEILLER